MKLKLLVIRTLDIKILADFYTNLGLSFEYHRHGKGPMHYSTILDGTIFEIYPLLKNQNEPDASLRLGFEVENLDELILKLEKEKVSIVTPPTLSEWGYFAVIKDLDGRKIELTKS